MQQQRDSCFGVFIPKRQGTLLETLSSPKLKQSVSEQCQATDILLTSRHCFMHTCYECTLRLEPKKTAAPTPCTAAAAVRSVLDLSANVNVAG